MASNFDFLHTHYPQLFEHASHAESLVYSAPRASCFYARFTLEQAVHWLYANDPYLQLPYDNSLATLIHEQTFQDNLKPGLFPKIRAIQKMGNIAVHDSTSITEKDALRLVQELFHFLYWLCRYYAPDGRTILSLSFDRDLIPHPAAPSSQDLSLQQLQALEAQLSQASQMRGISEERQRQTEQQLENLKAEIAALKQQNEAVPDTHDYNEADTRRYLLDILLKETGWNIEQAGWTEYEVHRGCPTRRVKAKWTTCFGAVTANRLPSSKPNARTKSPTQGKHQAKLYADCLEQRFGQRPIIFYTNGYDHGVWDDLNYPPREIQGLFKKDELERLIFRRSHRKRLHLVQVNPSIVERSYQTEAIRRITETFDEKKGRKSLGSGKYVVKTSKI